MVLLNLVQNLFMLHYRAIKYLLAFTSPAIAWISFHYSGIYSFALVIYAFLVIPIIELFIKPDHSNVNANDEKELLKAPFFNILIYAMVPAHYFLLLKFFSVMKITTVNSVAFYGHILTMGILCGIIGINIAHELGHRSSSFEKILAKSLLLTSLYMHFYIEHNRGHHKRVATPDDPASARKGEMIYIFWIRTIIFSYFSAWQLELKKLRKNKQSFFSWQNEMLRFHYIEFIFIFCIYYYFGITVMLSFIAAAIIGILLLEMVNYIEHYGLSRQPSGDGNFEKVMHYHSWNSDHLIGRLLLFELSRHSDHHHKASKPYQLLNSWEGSPQMPTGYPGMMILTLFPPIWFRVMHRKIDRLQNNN